MSFEGALLLELGVVHGCVSRYLKDGDMETQIDDMDESHMRVNEILQRIAQRSRDREIQPKIP